MLDIDHVLKEVGVGAVAQRAQLTFDELKTLWTTQSKFIEWAVLAGKVCNAFAFVSRLTGRAYFANLCHGPHNNACGLSVRGAQRLHDYQCL